MNENLDAQAAKEFFSRAVPREPEGRALSPNARGGSHRQWLPPLARSTVPASETDSEETKRHIRPSPVPA